MLEPWLAQLPAGLELIPASRALLPPAPLDWLAQVRPGWPGLPAPEPAAAADTLNQED
jgi:hypothetical protein